jgi:hypothetical protein
MGAGALGTPGGAELVLGVGVRHLLEEQALERMARSPRRWTNGLKVRLFARDRRATEPTRPGSGSSPTPAPSWPRRSAPAAVRAARRTPTFTVGFMPGRTVTASVRELSGRHPDLTAEVVRTNRPDLRDR